MDRSVLTHIEAVVDSGKVTISADDEVVVAIVQEAIKSGRTASFYLSREQAEAVKNWHWTPDRVRASGLKPVLSEERARIESELGIGDIGAFRCTRVQCKLGHTYGAFEFLQQGIREHGLDHVKSVFGLKNSAFLRVNPYLVAICPDCSQMIDGGIEYEGDTYAGCSYPDPPVSM